MDSAWWLAGAVICGACTVVGTLGNGLTIAIFAKYSQFRNIVGIFILWFVQIYYIKSAMTGVYFCIVLQCLTYCAACMSHLSMPISMQTQENGISTKECVFSIT